MTINESKALQICLQAHAGQKDKSGANYASHPIRVAWSLYEGTSEDMVVAALLHDVVEDTDLLSLEQIAAMFNQRVADAVDALSRRKGETYMAFINRCAQNTIARCVKLADIADNTRPERIAALPVAEQGITKRYARAKAILEVTP